MDKELIMQIQYIDLKYNEVIMSAEQANEMAELCKAHYRPHDPSLVIALKELTEKRTRENDRKIAIEAVAAIDDYAHSGYFFKVKALEALNKALGGDDG